MAADEEDGLLDTRLSAASTDMRGHAAGDVVGQRWRLERFLDGGGMGSVWQATDLRLEEPAAVKLLNPHLVRTPEAKERFLREARAAARLRGPNVVSVLDFDLDDDSGVPYMAMELLLGEDLATRLGRGALGYLQTRAVLGDVARAVARGHRFGVVHRDLKPGNIFLAAAEEGMVAKVLDFGIAKLVDDTGGRALTEPGRALGTPHYMSPEQISDAREVDHRADLWALAVIAYECLTGHLAFPGSAPVQVIRRICVEPATPPSEVADVPRGFDDWFARATRLDPDARFQSVEELIDGFLALVPEEGPAPAEPEPMPRPRPSRNRAWVSDANQVDIESIEDVVFRNATVAEFVDDDRRHFVSGAKGCGKTLLLTCKRARLTTRYQRGEDGKAVTFIPEGRPYLDLMGDLRNVGRSTLEFMSSLSQAKRLWGFALRMSIVSYSPDRKLPSSVLVALPPRLREVAEGFKAEPTVVAKEVLALTVSQIHQLLDEAEMALERALREVHSGIYVFVDKIDQALRGVSREAWVAMQAGLVEAAWDLMNTNPHVKVFATIREEAFSAYESDIKTNLFGATTRIRYSKADLRHMMERLTSYYEGLPLRDFVTLNTVSSVGGGQTESAFDFLHRHTLGRPRDFVIVASEISRRRSELDERTFKAIVLETSAAILIANVFDEMRVFLEVLGERQGRIRFLGLLPFGVLTREDLIEAWCRYHGVTREYFDNYASEVGDEVFHPFRELYDCGLLGLVRSDPTTGERTQVFKQPHHPLDADRFDLPTSEVYLLHPSLLALMQRLGLQDGFIALRNVVVGHGRSWPPLSSVLATIQRELVQAETASGGAHGVSHVLRGILEDVARRVHGGEPLGRVLAAVAATPSYQTVLERLEGLEWDELHLTLLESFSADTAVTREF